MTVTISSPLTLPCGVTLKNRLSKSAMTEGLGDALNRATDGHVRLYRRWAEGGAGMPPDRSRCRAGSSANRAP